MPLETPTGAGGAQCCWGAGRGCWSLSCPGMGRFWGALNVGAAGRYSHALCSLQGIAKSPNLFTFALRSLPRECLGVSRGLGTIFSNIC